ncbi:hypothetical protein RHSIM_Rhsim05G0142400 [Rhododendron simsii]|uniref:Peroxisomal adenine nucleotide carrier 1 n=1 Tax=Rhododendron simsii TaxID=118357 RepID=A0A834GVT5_RHOSS|nr:hypothetical protein RHSIM_Rhsim05G0142400 [Rhododendron simsii]
MQASTILNNLPPSWDSVVTAINCSGQVLTMDTLPAILALEEERKKHRKCSNLMVAEDSGRPTKKEKGPHDVKGKQFKHGNQFKNKNLISVSMLDEKGYEIKFAFSHVTIRKDGYVIVRGKKVDGISWKLVNNSIDVAGSCFFRNLADVFREAIRTGQINSLYQGLGTKNLQSFISQFVYFYGYSYFKRLYLVKSGSKSIGTTANLVLAAAAGACTAIVTQPLDTASSKMQTSAFGKSKGLWLTLTEGSWSEAFDGLGISLLLTSNPAIQYTVFDQLKQRLLKAKQNKTENAASTEALSAFSAFALGAISKSIATVLTYPAIRCKVMIQAADSNDNEASKVTRRSRKTVAWALCAIWKKEGVLGFFKGLHAQILKTVLSSALLLMIKEKITATTWILIRAMQRYLVLTRGRLKSA